MQCLVEPAVGAVAAVAVVRDAAAGGGDVEGAVVGVGEAQAEDGEVAGAVAQRVVVLVGGGQPVGFEADAGTEGGGGGLDVGAGEGACRRCVGAAQAARAIALALADQRFAGEQQPFGGAGIGIDARQGVERFGRQGAAGEPPGVFARHAVTVGQAERRERQPAAEQPGQYKDTAVQAEEVVVALPAAAIGRQPSTGIAAAPAQALPAEPDAADGEQQGDEAKAQHGIAP